MAAKHQDVLGTLALEHLRTAIFFAQPSSSARYRGSRRNQNRFYVASQNAVIAAIHRAFRRQSVAFRASLLGIPCQTRFTGGVQMRDVSFDSSNTMPPFLPAPLMVVSQIAPRPGRAGALLGHARAEARACCPGFVPGRWAPGPGAGVQGPWRCPVPGLRARAPGSGPPGRAEVSNAFSPCAA